MTSRHRVARSTSSYRAEGKLLLPLSKQQADILYIVLQHVGGSPAGPRGVIDGVRGTLEDGFITEPDQREGRVVVVHNSIYLEEGR